MLVGKGEFIESIQTNRLEKSSVLPEIIALEARTWQSFVVVLTGGIATWSVLIALEFSHCS
jgi:hypothetical protein